MDALQMAYTPKIAETLAATAVYTEDQSQLQQLEVPSTQ